MSKKDILRKFLSIFFTTVGVALAVYVGVYKMFLVQIYHAYQNFANGTMTIRLVVHYAVSIFLAMTVAGAIWAVFDIISSKFKDKEE